MDDSVIKCPKCGHENDASSEECEKCGVTLMLVLRDKKKPKAPAEPNDPKVSHATSLSHCPKCGHEVAGEAEECIKCGIIFTKYFEIQERKLRESQDDFESPAEERLEDEGRQEETVEASGEDEARREDARRAQEKARKDERKAQQLKKQREEAVKAEAQKTKAAGKETAAEAPPAEAGAAVADEEDRKRLAHLEAEAENLRAQNDALMQDKQEREKADIIQKAQQEQERQDILKQAQEARAKISSLENETEALKKEAATLKKEADALKKEKEALEAAEAQREAQAMQAAEALQKDREDARRRTQTILETVLPKPTMKELLKKYEGEAIGINFDDPAEIKNAILAKVNEDHFSIMVPENELVHSYPYSDIVSIVEGMDGVPLDASEEAPRFPVVIKVFHLMVKKKWGFI